MKTLLVLATASLSLLAAAVAIPAEATEITLDAGANATVEITATPAVATSPLLNFDPSNTALVITDPQNDFLSPDGVVWGVVGESVTKNNTVANLDALFHTAKAEGFPVFVSPHYYFPHDKQWQFEGTLEKLMHTVGMFDRNDALDLEGFEGSGADWLERYKPYIQDGATVVTSPHKVYGPDTNDLVLQLRKRGIDRVILAGMSANLCTESHMRELLEQGFDVTVVSDATAAAITPDLGDGYAAALVNFRFMANAVLDTATAVASMGAKVTDTYGSESIQGLDIHFHEAGRIGSPQIVLLHGFPTSSHMFRNLIPELAKDFHVIAPDYPGYGQSSAPSNKDFDYTFANIAGIVDTLLERRGFDRYALYLMDYGAPIAFRIAEKHPERVTGLIVQNGNAYDEGLREFWDPIKAYWGSNSEEDRDALRGLLTLGATKWQYQDGTRNPESIDPANWQVVQPLLDREGNQEIQLDLFYDYRTNVVLYPRWQEYLRTNQPPTLILWGANDPIFPSEGAHPYLRDLPNAELHLLNTGHFALEEEGQQIAKRMGAFLLGKPAPVRSAAH
ncbi:MAG: pimeloyl-ACP methyl ester carboxylesterase/nicotinamidase-related amidase [Gammaproteobacteria bacterium]|jgi:pimeloyl-ACP methyl ester carboxylesterase/nicotinamidase-related amidase